MVFWVSLESLFMVFLSQKVHIHMLVFSFNF